MAKGNLNLLEFPLCYRVGDLTFILIEGIWNILDYIRIIDSYGRNQGYYNFLDCGHDSYENEPHNDSLVYGQDSLENDSLVHGQDNFEESHDGLVYGQDNHQKGDDDLADGHDDLAYGHDDLVYGHDSLVYGHDHSMVCCMSVIC